MVHIHLSPMEIIKVVFKRQLSPSHYVNNTRYSLLNTVESLIFVGFYFGVALCKCKSKELLNFCEVLSLKFLSTNLKNFQQISTHRISIDIISCFTRYFTCFHCWAYSTSMVLQILKTCSQIDCFNTALCIMCVYQKLSTDIFWYTKTKYR